MTIANVQISILPSVAFEERQDLPAIPAVYFVLDARRQIAYIGEASDLQARWAGKRHQRAPQMHGGGYRIHWRQAPIDAAERKTAEREAINYFQPLWNRTEVPTDEMQEIVRYIRAVARHMGMDPHDLHRQILKEWAYNRSFGGEVS
jgi:hypothetical protein